MKHAYLYLSVFNICFGMLLYFILPHHRETLGGEDMIIENLTAAFFLFAALSSIYYLLIGNIKKSRKLLGIIIVFGLLAFLDELSFGERIFDLSMPTLDNKKVDGLHDLLKLSYVGMARFLKTLPKLVLASGAILFFSLVAYFIIRFRENIKKIIQHIFQSMPWFFIFASGVVLLLAMLMDMHIIYFESIMYIEELFELNAGMALLFSSYSAYKLDVTPVPVMAR